MFQSFPVKIFRSLFKVWQLATILGALNTIVHITVCFSPPSLIVYAVECVAGSILRFALSCSYALINSFILYVLRIPRWMKVTEKCCKKCMVDLNRLFFFSKPILHYNLAFVFQGTVGRRNTKLRNESVIFLYIWVFNCNGELRSYAQHRG